jgi:hypothetical protein
VRRIQRHNILVMGSFIIGLDIDDSGIGARVAETAKQYGVDSMNALFLTPLPGTRLWDQMKSEDRITLNSYPEDWRYYTLTFPVARYTRLTSDGVIKEMVDCNRLFYSIPGVMRRVWSCFWQNRKPLINLVTNLSTRNNSRVESLAYSAFRKHLQAAPPRPLAVHAAIPSVAEASGAGPSIGASPA